MFKEKTGKMDTWSKILEILIFFRKEKLINILKRLNDNDSIYLLKNDPLYIYTRQIIDIKRCSPYIQIGNLIILFKIVFTIVLSKICWKKRFGRFPDYFWLSHLRMAHLKARLICHELSLSV